MTDQLLLSFDKKGAEWVIVAYLANDPTMIDVVRSGKSPHTVTGALMSRCPEALILKESKIIGEATDADWIAAQRVAHLPELLSGPYEIPRSMSIRQQGKKSNHGGNYGESYKTFALTNEISETDAKRTLALYHRSYPGIQKTYHAFVDAQLRKDRTLYNCFGRKCYFMGMMGSDLFRQGYAFIPQSTVGDMVNEGLILSMEDDAPYMRDIHLLEQKHDSGVFQYPVGQWHALAQAVAKIGLDYMSPECEYNGHRFHIDTELKIGFNRRQMTEVPLTRDVDVMACSLQEAWDALQMKAAA